MQKAKTPPWKKPKPKGSRTVKLTESEKKEARANAEKAGRRYPNLVDNMKYSQEEKEIRLIRRFFNQAGCFSQVFHKVIHE
ncbi:MAG: hypothetical protein U1E36_00935 [Rickettsiales bacterium]